MRTQRANLVFSDESFTTSYEMFSIIIILYFFANKMLQKLRNIIQTKTWNLYESQTWIPIIVLIMYTVLKCIYRASLVAQWLRICLPMQGARVWAGAREDLTCRRATNPMHHNYWACALELTCHNYWARMPQLLKAAHLEPVLRNKRSHCNEKPAHCNKE